MFNLEFQASADENLDFIFSYISIDDKVMAIKVIQKINYTIQNLKSFPYMGKLSYLNLREIIEPKYKFRILYEIRENTIFIVSIFKNKNNY